MMANKKQYNSVSEMVRDITGDDDQTKALAERISKRQIIKQFMALRSVGGFSQADIARKMGCSQSRISKLESAIDDDWSLGDIEEYLDALGFEAKLVVTKQGATLADRIKSTWVQLCRLLDELRAVANGDPDIERGIGQFSNQIAFNFFGAIASFIAKLPDGARAHAPEMKIEFLESALPGETQPPQSKICNQQSAPDDKAALPV